MQMLVTKDTCFFGFKVLFFGLFAVFGNIPFWCNWLFCSRKRYLWEWEQKQKYNDKTTSYQIPKTICTGNIFLLLQLTTHYSSHIDDNEQQQQQKNWINNYKKVNEQTSWLSHKHLWTTREGAEGEERKKHVKTVWNRLIAEITFCPFQWRS